MDAEKKTLVAKTSDGIFYMFAITSLIQGIQLASLPWNSNGSESTIISWPNWMSQFLYWLSFSRANVFGESQYLFIVIYLVLGIMLIVFIILFFSSQCCDICECIMEGISPELAEQIYSDFLYGVCFIPLLTMIFETFHCTSDGRLYKVESITCYSGVHNALIAFACITFLILLFGAIFIAIENNRSSHFGRCDSNGKYNATPGNMRKNIHYYWAKYITYRSLIVIVNIFLLPISYSGAVSVCFFLTLLPFIHVLYWLPHTENRYNYVKAVQYCFPVWGFFVSAIASAKNMGNFATVLFFFYPAIILLTLVMVIKRNKKKPLTLDDIDTGNDKPTDSEVEKLAKKHDFPVERCLLSSKNNEYDIFADLVQCENRTDLQLLGIIRTKERVTADKSSSDLFTSVGTILSNNPEMNVLLLQGHKITANNIIPLMQQIKSHSALKKLDLFQNQIDDNTAIYIVDEIKDVKSLKRINFGSNYLSGAGKLKIKSIMEQKKHLKIMF